MQELEELIRVEAIAELKLWQSYKNIPEFTAARPRIGKVIECLTAALSGREGADA